jgi:coenzyme F420-reducing hydrogenase gamma subunit
MPTKVAFMQLASCWGCHQSLLNAHLDLAPLLIPPVLDFVYWPAVVDHKWESMVHRADGSVDIGFLEGFIRTKEDEEHVNVMRKKCKILVSYGSCACYGSVASMANMYPIADCKQRKFVEQPTYEKGSKVPSENVPPILDKVTIPEKLVTIDAWLPGCPPQTDNILGSVMWVLNNTAFAAPNPKSACESCTLGDAKCLLNGGNLCLGFLTADPGKKITPTKEVPVLGEYGKTTKPAMVQAEKLAGILAKVKDLPKEIIEKLNEFYLLWTGVANFGMLTLNADILYKLLLDPKAAPVKDVTLKAGTLKAYDIALPGMPAIVNQLVGAALYAMRQSGSLKLRDANVCNHCDRKIPENGAIQGAYKREFMGLVPDPKVCFLAQGYLCMGPLTRSGCGGKCPNNANTVCEGCFGPIGQWRALDAKYEEAFAKMTGTTAANMKEKLKDPQGLMYRFTTAAKKEAK